MILNNRAVRQAKKENIFWLAGVLSEILPEELKVRFPNLEKDLQTVRKVGKLKGILESVKVEFPAWSGPRAYYIDGGLGSLETLIEAYSGVWAQKGIWRFFDRVFRMEAATAGQKSSNLVAQLLAGSPELSYEEAKELVSSI